MLNREESGKTPLSTLQSVWFFVQVNIPGVG